MPRHKEMGEANLRCPKTGYFFAIRLKELQSPAIAAMRHPSICGSRKIGSDWVYFQRYSPICNSTFGAFWEARPLSRGLVSFSESGKPITTAHPYFLLFDTAKLDSPNAAYLRSRKKLQKKFSDDKRPLFWTPQKLLVNLHHIPIYWKWKSLNSIESRLCLPKQTSRENGWLSNLAKTPQRSQSGVPIPYSLIWKRLLK